MREDRPSTTAGLIPWAIAAQARLPELAPLVPPGAAQACGWFIEALRPGSLRALERSSPGRLRLQLALFDRFSIPGICLHYLVRKRFLESAVRAALTEGVRRVLVLGAGFDTLCLRLHREFPGVAWVECDHPATQAVKLRALAGRVEIAPNLRFVAADFTKTTLEAALAGLPELARVEPTVMVAEGLTMYLTAAEVERLFAFLAARGGPGSRGSRVVFTFLEPRPDGRADFRRRSPLLRWWLRRQGEPFRWGIARAELAGFLAPLGFAPLEIVADRELRERILTPLGLAERTLAEGEAVCVAESLSR